MRFIVKESKCSITDFYNEVARQMGYGDTSALKYDCRNITVAPNIQENFFEYYREINPGLPESDVRLATAMALIQCGPKVDDTLKANEVEVYYGFIC